MSRPNPLSKEFLDWATRRMGELSHEAEALTSEIGLPKEAKWLVLAEVHRQEREAAGQAKSEATSEDHQWDLLYRILDGVLAQQTGLVRERQRLQTAWKALRRLPMATVAANPGRQAGAVGLGFSDQQTSQVLAIASLAAWIMLHPTASVERVLQEARRRDCPRAVAEELRARLASDDERATL